MLFGDVSMSFRGQKTLKGNLSTCKSPSSSDLAAVMGKSFTVYHSDQP